jgi:hypothetical protein
MVHYAWCCVNMSYRAFSTDCQRKWLYIYLTKLHYESISVEVNVLNPEHLIKANSRVMFDLLTGLILNHWTAFVFM